jgi:small multidrug resistance pump
MAWLVLVGAIASEVVATSALKLSDGFSRLTPSIVSAVGYVLSLVLLSWALKLHMQVSVAYAIWAGAGTAAIAVIGLVLLDEPLTVPKCAGIVLIVAGTVVLNLTGAA